MTKRDEKYEVVHIPPQAPTEGVKDILADEGYQEEVRQTARTCTISEQIRRRKWRWIGHLLRMDHQQNPRIALIWASEGKRIRGRPRETWRRTAEGER